MTPALALTEPCPKCKYHDGVNTWRGPKYVPVSDRLRFECEACGYAIFVPCCDAKGQG